MPTGRALLFDLDGTLVDSLRDLLTAVNRVLDSHRRPVRTLEELRGMVGDGLPLLLERAWGEPLGAGEAAPLIASFQEHYARCALEHTEPYPGMEEVMVAGAGHALAVVSNKPERFCRQIVAGLGWAERFEVVCGGDTHSERKPSALPLTETLRALDVPPSQALMIGDGLPDLRSARAAGVRSVAVTWGFTPRERLLAERPDFVVEDPAALTELIRAARW